MRRAALPVSCLLGGLLGGGLVAMIGAGQEEPSPRVGRYQIVMSTISNKSTYLVDTVLGDTWVLTSGPSPRGADALIWQSVPRWEELNDAERKELNDARDAEKK